MKKYLYLITLFSFAFLLVGCGSSGEEADAANHDTYNNSVTCTYTAGFSEEKINFYFDKDDKVIGFDYYSYYDSSKISDAEYKQAEQKMCNGNSEWKKEWINTCEFDRNSDKVSAHVYVDSDDWLGDTNTKSDILNATFTKIESFNCKEN